LFISSSRPHTRANRDCSSDVCSSDLEDVYVPGSGFGHQHRGMSMEDAKEFLAAPYKAEFGNLGDILMNTLNGILKAVVDGIVARSEERRVGKESSDQRQLCIA